MNITRTKIMAGTTGCSVNVRAILVVALLKIHRLEAFAPRNFASATPLSTHILRSGLPDHQEVWIYQEPSDDNNNKEIQWVQEQASTCSINALEETWRWCRDFVVPLNLCPWASASVSTESALQLYVIPPEISRDEMVSITESAAQRLVELIQRKPELAKVAIFFLVLTPSTSSRSSSWYDDFYSYYEWFQQLEDDWIDQGFERDDDEDVHNLITLAAFHPEWEFGEETPGGLDFEKRSPHPTLTLVWTETIDTAGPEATERIAQHNAQILGQDMTQKQVEELYKRVVWDGGEGEWE
jgi:uncharacterized protein